MRVVFPGGSGQVGAILHRAFPEDEVIVIGRGGPVVWDGRTLGPWAEAIDGADVVINLAGRSVNCRYNDANRRAIMDSRVDSTRVLGEAIARAANPPRVWLQSSTATIYADRYDAPNDERTGIIGDGFSVGVAQAWERAAVESCPPGTRLVLLRSSMIMSPDRGGIFDVLLGLVRRRLGGNAAGGRQYVSWIHGEDFARGVGDADRASGDALDARDRRVGDAHGDRARAQEPARGGSPAGRGGLRVRLSGVAGRGARPRG